MASFATAKPGLRWRRLALGVLAIVGGLVWLASLGGVLLLLLLHVQEATPAPKAPHRPPASLPVSAARSIHS